MKIKQNQVCKETKYDPYIRKKKLSRGCPQENPDIGLLRLNQLFEIYSKS